MMQPINGAGRSENGKHAEMKRGAIARNEINLRARTINCGFNDCSFSLLLFYASRQGGVLGILSSFVRLYFFYAGALLL